MRVWVVFLVAGALSGCLDSDSSSPGDEVGNVVPLCVPCHLPIDLTVGRAIEPSAAVNPADASHWLVSSMEWEAEGLGPIVMKTHVSFDSGQTWESQTFPGNVPPNHLLNKYTHFADGNVMLFDDGSALLTAMATTGTVTPGSLPPGPVPAIVSFDIIAVRSDDGGRTWSTVTIVLPGAGIPVLPTQLYGDQPFVARGPNGELLMALLHVLVQDEGNSGQQRNDVIASMSYDDGASWSMPVTIAEGGNFHRARPTIAPDGELIVAFSESGPADKNYPVFLARSRGGTTWNVEPLPFESSRGTWIAADEQAVYLVSNPQVDRVSTIMLNTLRDNWTSEVIWETEVADIVTPSLVLTDAGKLVVTSQRPMMNERGYWAWVKDDNGTREVQLNPEPLGENIADGLLSWPIFGDYQGLVAHENGVLAVWIDGNAEDTNVRATWLNV